MKYHNTTYSLTRSDTCPNTLSRYLWASHKSSSTSIAPFNIEARRHLNCLNARTRSAAERQQTREAEHADVADAQDSDEWAKTQLSSQTDARDVYGDL